MPRLPRDVRDALSLTRGERVLAHAATAEGSFVAATGDALHVPDDAGGFVRLPWERVLQATWRDGSLVVRADDGDRTLRFPDAGSVPEVVQERVTATVVVNRHFTLPEGGGVLVVGRRPPRSRPSAARDELLWTLVFDGGLDPADPGLRAQAEQLLEAVRRQTGL